MVPAFKKKRVREVEVGKLREDTCHSSQEYALVVSSIVFFSSKVLSPSKGLRICHILLVKPSGTHFGLHKCPYMT